MNPSKVDQLIFQAPIVYIVDAFYVFGGSTGIKVNNQWQGDTTIGKLDAELVWSKVGDLNESKWGHNVIFDGNYALVIGGRYTMPTEKCTLSTSEVNCTEQNPSLYEYAIYPELFLVPSNFCQNLI